MSTDRHHCPNLLIPGLVGGLVGAALTEASHRQSDVLLRQEMEKIADLERERLAEEKKRHRLTQAEVQHREADRAYHRAVLWLSHCHNEERLDYLVAQHRETFARQLAERLTTDALRHPPIAELLTAHADTCARLKQSRQEHFMWQQESTVLQRDRWTSGGVFLTGLFSGGAIMTPLLYALGSQVIPYGVLFGLAIALLSPVAVKLQPPTARLRSGSDSATPTRTFALHQARHALVGALRAEVIARLERQLAVPHEELRRLFAANQSTWLAAAENYVRMIRPLIEAAQGDYPPRVRCDLGALSDTAILARLRDTLPPAFATQLEHLLHN